MALRTRLCVESAASTLRRNRSFESYVLQVLQRALHPARSGMHYEALAGRIGCCRVDTATQQAPAVFCDFVRSQQPAGLA